MGRLVQVCEDFAEGRQADEAWRRLIGDSVAGRQSIVFAECSIAIQNGNLTELSDAFDLLSTPEAARQAEVQHQKQFQFETGIHRLTTIRQAIACASPASV